MRTTDVQNPFSYEYHKREVSLFLSPSATCPHSLNNIAYRVLTAGLARIDDFFTPELSDGEIIPAFYKDGQTWMTITRMEAQSMYIPLLLAQGKVGTSGLGLGYFPIRAAMNPNVNEVHVYEIDRDVIALFDVIHEDLTPEIRRKIHIHHLDFYAISNESFDLFLADHYKTAGQDRVPDDYDAFCVSNSANRYRTWAQEIYTLAALECGMITKRSLTHQDKLLLTHFVNSGLASMKRNFSAHGDYEFLDRMVAAYKRGMK